MGIFDRFPYSSTHEMNLDFMLGKATEIAEDMQTVTTGMAQVQAGLSAISEKTEQATQAAAQAAQSASSIEGSVTAAEEAAEEAQMHNESAQTWANNALTYKADCQRAATEAAASSSSAAQAATAAAASEDTVATYAQAANASAQSAANNNDSAHQYANQASASASNATFHSSNAQTAATNANTSATNAETAATNAQTAATRTAALKDDCETLHRMCTAAVDQAATEAVNAANSAAQAAAAKTDVDTLVESLPEDFTDLNNTVNQLSDEIAEVKDAVLPDSIIADTALEYYPLTVPNGAKVQIDCIEPYTKQWAALFYADDKSTLLAQKDITITDTIVTIPINVEGVAYYRPNTNFTGKAKVTILTGESLTEKNAKNVADITANATAIAETASELQELKAQKLNLLPETLMPGRVYSGVYNASISTVHCTDFIPVVPGHTYAIYGGMLESASYDPYYDTDKIYKGEMAFDTLINSYPYNASYNCALYIAPTDCRYIRLNYSNEVLVDGTTLPADFYLRDVTNTILAQKKVLVIGDSISTDVYGGYKKWVTDLIDSGTFSKGFCKNSSQHATGFVATYSSNATTTFLARLTALGDISDLDMIITFGGINDWIQSVPFDDFKTAVDAYFAYLVEHATQARIVFLSPLHTARYGETNSVGKTQKDYADYIKEVAKSYAYPLLNLTDESGFCPDKSQAFNDMWTLLPEGYTDHDGVHPNADWEKKYLAPQIASFISGLI